MSDGTKIEWTEATWNPIRARNRATGGVGHFCVHVSPGCVNCYAERLQPRFKNPVRFAAQDRGKVEIFLDEKVLTQPLRWRKPRMIFVCSMTDLFAEWVPDVWIDQVFAVMALAPQHTFQVLTKRSARMRAWFGAPRAHTAPAECIAELYVSHPETAWRWPFDAQRADGSRLAADCRPRNPHPTPSPQGGGEPASAAFKAAAAGRAGPLPTCPVPRPGRTGWRALSAFDIWRHACREAAAAYRLKPGHVSAKGPIRGTPPVQAARRLALWLARRHGVAAGTLAAYAGLSAHQVGLAIARIADAPDRAAHLAIYFATSGADARLQTARARGRRCTSSATSRHWQRSISGHGWTAFRG